MNFKPLSGGVKGGNSAFSEPSAPPAPAAYGASGAPGWGGFGATSGAWNTAPARNNYSDDDDGTPPPVATGPVQSPFATIQHSQPQPLYNGPPQQAPQVQTAAAMPPPTAQAVAPALTKPPTFFQRQRASGKNFPPCCPFFKHDISGEIPADMQTTVRKAFYVWMGVNICLVYQFICASCALGLDVDSKVISWFLAVIFAILGSPLAFILWYLRLYNAAAYNTAMAYFLFYMFFALHIAYLIYSIVIPPFQHQRWCFTSFPIAIAAFDKAAVWLGAMYIVGAALWSLLLAYSLYVLREVYAVRRARGNKAAVAQPGV